MARSRATARPLSPRAQLQAVTVEMTAAECDAHDAWRDRAIAVGGPLEPLIKFADWYAGPAERWFVAAAEAGVWEPSPESRGRGWRDCRRPLEALAHSERSDGVLIHHLVDAESRPYAFRARWCRDASPFAFTQRWTDDEQLTWEEFLAGEPCRACGRGFVGGPEWKPILQRTPEEAAAWEREEAAFRALHPGCPTFSWRYGSSGLTHCAQCCPRPPLSPRQSDDIARILVDIVMRQEREAGDLERRWRGTAPPSMP